MTDTSKEHIKMCRKAVEIQELWEPKKGDWCFDLDYDYVLIFSGMSDRYDYKFQNIKEKPHDSLWYYDLANIVIWLPRQDQLQKMVKISEYEFRIYTLFLDELNCTQWKMDFNFKNRGFQSVFGFSIEQLWLAFVMHEKYQKKWNGEEWIPTT